jgi:hypothetical protein
VGIKKGDKILYDKILNLENLKRIKDFFDNLRHFLIPSRTIKTKSSKVLCPHGYGLAYQRKLSEKNGERLGFVIHAKLSKCTLH